MLRISHNIQYLANDLDLRFHVVDWELKDLERRYPGEQKQTYWANYLEETQSIDQRLTKGDLKLERFDKIVKQAVARDCQSEESALSKEDATKIFDDLLLLRAHCGDTHASVNKNFFDCHAYKQGDTSEMVSVPSEASVTSDKESNKIELTAEQESRHHLEGITSIIEVLKQIASEIQTNDSFDTVNSLIHRADVLMRETRAKLLCDDSEYPEGLIMYVRADLYKELRSIRKKETVSPPEEPISSRLLQQVETASSENRLRAVNRIIVKDAILEISLALKLNDLDAVAYGLKVLEEINLDPRDKPKEVGDCLISYLHGELYRVSKQMRTEDPQLISIDEDAACFEHNFGAKGWTDDRVHLDIKKAALESL